MLGRRISLSDLPVSDEDWYLDVFWIARQKCLLLTHSGTLFSIFRAPIRVSDVDPLGEYLEQIIDAEVRREGLPPTSFTDAHDESWRFARTADRRTLGHMTQMTFELKDFIAHDGGLANSDLDDLNHWLRHSLRGNDNGYAYPIELLERRNAAS